MKIEKDQIAHKEVLGHTEDREPVTYVETTGGLHVIFKKNRDGKVESIAASPHKTISMWMAEKKHNITWNELEKSEKEPVSLVRLFYSPPVLVKSEQDQGYLVLDTRTGALDLLPAETVLETDWQSMGDAIYKTIIRKADYTDSPQTLYHFLNQDKYEPADIYGGER